MNCPSSPSRPYSIRKSKTRSEDSERALTRGLLQVALESPVSPGLYPALSVVLTASGLASAGTLYMWALPAALLSKGPKAETELLAVQQ